MKLKDLSKKQKLYISLLAILMLIILFVSILISSVLAIIVKTPDTILENLSNSFNQTSSIYSENGKLLEKIDSLEYRTIVPLKKIPKNLQMAFVAIEDHRFFEHNGLDPIGIGASILTNLKTGAFTRGGSTITQQMVRSIYLTNDKNFNRKIQEAYLALRVEENLSKGQILEAYLNRINLGQGAYGVQAASQTYFSKNVWELNTSECAILASIAKSPAEYPPFKTVPSQYISPEDILVGNRVVNGEEMYLILNQKSLDRQKIVLKRMYELNYIDKNQYKEALNFDIVGDLKPANLKHHTMSSYSTDFIKQDAAKYLAKYYKISLDEGEHKLFTGGYKVYSSIDENLQNKVENLYKNFAQNFIENKSSKGGSKMLNFSLDEFGSIIYNNEILYYKRFDHFAEDFSFIVNPSDYNISSKNDIKINRRFFRQLGKKIDFIDLYVIDQRGILNIFDIGNLNIDSSYMAMKKNYLIIDGSFVKEHSDFYRIDQNKNLIINPTYINLNKNPIIEPQSASIIADNKNGFVKAIVGGLDVETNKAKILNRAVDSHRSPGTLIKPFTVYLPALENSYTLGTVIDDVPITTDGYMWPENNYKSFKGLMTLRMAIENSSNVVCAKILKDLGLEKAKEVLQRFNIIENNPSDYSYIDDNENSDKNDMNLNALGLGNMKKGISLAQITSMYQTLANEGDFKDLTAIVKIEDNTGKVIIDNRANHKNIINKETAYLLKDALKTNVEIGNAKGSKIDSATTYAYKGTNEFSSDFWLVGFSKKYTIGTWLGADSPKISLNADEDIITKIFNELSSNINDDSKDEYRPSFIVEKNICNKSGKLGTELTNDAGANYKEIFIKGTEPTDYDDLYKKVLICVDSGLLSTQYCPAESVEYNVLFERPGGYDPKEHYNIYPDDYVEIPKKYCDIHTRSWYKENVKGSEDKNNEND